MVNISNKIKGREDSDGGWNSDGVLELFLVEGGEILRILGVLTRGIVIVRTKGETRNGGMSPGKVRNEAKTSNAELRLRSIELRNHIRSTYCLAYHYHGTEVARLGLVVERLLDARVANENEGTGLKVEVDDARTMAFLKLFEVIAASFCNSLLEVCNVFWPFSELASPKRDELRS